jgi:hypothetical protein
MMKRSDFYFLKRQQPGAGLLLLLFVVRFFRFDIQIVIQSG